MKPSDIVEQGIAQVLEGRRIFSELTVNENLRLGGHTASKDIKENTDRIYDLFPLLAPRAKDVAGYLSGGEQQMLAIGRALMSNPKCLLLDEPSLGLAPKLVDQIKEFIVEINQQGVSVLLVEQNANMALSIATHGYIMEEGISSDLFEKFERVYSGHFHTRSNQGGIYYLGNPYEIFWNDYKDKRGFHIFDTETLEHTPINNTYRIFYNIYYDDYCIFLLSQLRA